MLKLLYFLDFQHFKQTGKSTTGLDYYAWNMGPVPKDLFNELTEKMNPDLKAAIHDLPQEGFQKIRPKKKFDSKYFSSWEMKLLKALAFIFKDAKADDMIESMPIRLIPKIFYGNSIIHW